MVEQQLAKPNFSSKLASRVDELVIENTRNFISATVAEHDLLQG